MKCFAVVLFAFAAATLAQARLGETEAQMIARLGQPTLRSTHNTVAQGKSWEMGPVLHFRQEDWRIRCELVDGRCVRVGYDKTGDWTDEQIKMVLAYNSQGAAWTDTSKDGSKSFQRTWRRSDGAEALWNKGSGMQLVVPAYERAKKVIEAKAKAAASAKPKI